MVCIECNGKGYKIFNHREVVCDECGGHGEHPTLEADDRRPPQTRSDRDAI